MLSSRTQVTVESNYDPTCDTSKDDETKHCSSDTRKRQRSQLTFVNEVPPHLLCVFCMHVLVQAVLLPCGDKSHPQCFKEQVRSTGSSACPSCDKKISPGNVVPDDFVEEELGLLVVYCSEKSSGCTWQGQRNALEEHLKTCEFVEVERRIMGWREETARRNTGESQSTECGPDSKQKPVSRHTKHGEKYDDAGIPRRQDTRNKSYSKEQLFHCESEQTRQVISLNEQILHVQGSLEDLRVSTEGEAAQITLQTESIQREARDLDRRTTSLKEQLVHLKDHQTTMKEKSVTACKESVQNVRREANTRLGSIDQYLKLINEKVDKLEEVSSKNGQRIQKQEEGWRSARSGQSGSVSTAERHQFVAQDRVLAVHDIKLAEHGLRMDMMDCKNTNGTLLWKITEVRRRRRDAISGKTLSIYSQPFYSSPCGYKMCGRLYLNGDGMGKGTHLSLFFVVMRGEYDSLLSWPFKQRVTLVLVNQDGRRHLSDAFRPDSSSSSFQRPRSEMNIASGCPLFVPLTALESGEYVKDDVMYVKVIVDTTGLFAPDAR